jgi:hypothetical protein
LWLNIYNLGLLALLLDDWHLDNSLWSGDLEDLVILHWSIGNDLLLADLLDEFLGFLEELELSQFLLKELKSADLVDASEDEEKNDWAHLVHNWPVLDGILLVILIRLDIWTMMTIPALLSSLGMLVKGWSVDSVHLSLEVELGVEVLFVFIGHLGVVFISSSIVLVLVRVVVLFHVFHHFFEVLRDILVEGSIELHVNLIEHFLVSLHDIIEFVKVSMASSEISLGGLSQIGNEGGVVKHRSFVIMLLDPIKSSLEDSRLFSSENVEDEEGKEHEEVSIEHSFGNS